LLVRQPTGDRIVLGLCGRRLVAAERLQSALVVGPSQSGKTTGLAIPALVDWAGPVLATSVKTDLVRETIGARSARGEVAVFDPTAVTGLSDVEARSWSPLSQATTWAGARRVADSLCSVGRKAGGIEDASYWYAAAERLLAPLLRAAAVVNGSMSDVVRWLDEEAVNEPILALELADERDAARVAKSCASMEERQRSSVYSTAQTILAAYGDPDVVASERHGLPLSPDWLLTGGDRPRTLYCCSPARDQSRLSPVFVALVRQVVDTAFDAAARLGRPIDPPLLLVLDEAANIAPLGDLDQILATAAGHGLSLVTIWQDLAQIEARYGERWATIVNNHRAKAICPGVADPRTLDLLSSLIGDIEVAQHSTSRTGDGTWSESESAWRVPIAPAGWIRRMPERHVLVVYGGMPPALVRMRSGPQPR
jgi:type IV secretion system protein VirD4